jgi:hypothetical protein
MTLKMPRLRNGLPLSFPRTMRSNIFFAAHDFEKRLIRSIARTLACRLARAGKSKIKVHQGGSSKHPQARAVRGTCPQAQLRLGCFFASVAMLCLLGGQKAAGQQGRQIHVQAHKETHFQHHTLFAFAADVKDSELALSSLLCSSCGHYAQTNLRGLTGRCSSDLQFDSPAVAARRFVLRRTAAHKRPDRNKKVRLAQAVKLPPSFTASGPPVKGDRAALSRSSGFRVHGTLR